MSNLQAAIVGLGMTRFGKHMDRSLKSLGGEAIDRALADAGMEKSEVELAFIANSMSSIITGQVSVVGQNILRANGFAEIPVFNIDNACASSSSALNLAVQAIRSGAAQAVLVVGAEKLYSEDRAQTYRALNGAADIDFMREAGVDPGKGSVFVAAIYPERLESYRRQHGLQAETLARIAVKNRRHAAANPDAQYTEPLTVEDVLASRQVVGPLTALMCAPISDGASAAVLVHPDRIAAGQRPVWVRGSAVGMGSSDTTRSTVSRVAARAFAEADIKPSQVDVAEVHDSIAFNELLAYEDLGFCKAGEGARLVEEGATSLGGSIPVNTSGGLESRGHPVAATGLGQIVELATQLRAEAGKRQVPSARIALAENAGGFARDDTAAVAVTILGV